MKAFWRWTGMSASGTSWWCSSIRNHFRPSADRNQVSPTPRVSRCTAYPCLNSHVIATAVVMTSPTKIAPNTRSRTGRDHRLTGIRSDPPALMEDERQHHVIHREEEGQDQQPGPHRRHRPDDGDDHQRPDQTE